MFTSRLREYYVSCNKLGNRNKKNKYGTKAKWKSVERMYGQGSLNRNRTEINTLKAIILDNCSKDGVESIYETIIVIS